MDLCWRRLDLRGRLCHLWRESQLCRPHNRASHCRNWRRWHFLRRIDHHREIGTTIEETSVYRNHWRSMGYSKRGWPLARGCFYKSVPIAFHISFIIKLALTLENPFSSCLLALVLL